MTTLDQIRSILQNYGGLESNIPTNHCYWDLLTKLRAGVMDAPPCNFVEGSLYAPPEPTQLRNDAKIAAIRAQLAAIMITFDNKEPNIPYNNEYWFLQNQLRSLLRVP